MRKITKIMLIVACLSLVGLLATLVWATEETVQQESWNVTVDYEITDAQTIYSVNINWDSMKLRYVGNERTWDPNNHEYIEADKHWVYADGEVTLNQITISSDSGVDLRAAFNFVPTDGLNLVGEFFDALEAKDSRQALYAITVPSAESTGNTTSRTVEFEITSGEITEEQAREAIGAITITITDAGESNGNRDEGIEEEGNATIALPSLNYSKNFTIDDYNNWSVEITPNITENNTLSGHIYLTIDDEEYVCWNRKGDLILIPSDETAEGETYTILLPTGYNFILDFVLVDGIYKFTMTEIPIT